MDLSSLWNSYIIICLKGCSDETIEIGYGSAFFKWEVDILKFLQTHTPYRRITVVNVWIGNQDLETLGYATFKINDNLIQAYTEYLKRLVSTFGTQGIAYLSRVKNRCESKGQVDQFLPWSSTNRM